MAESSVTTPPDLPKPPPDLMPEAAGPAEDQSKWPRVIGVISIIYGAGGLLCSASMGAMAASLEALMKLQGADVAVPVTFKAVNIVLALINLILGVMLVAGGIKLLRRRRSGVRLIQRWAVLRMAMLFIGVLTIFITSSTQIDMARAQAQAQMRGGSDSSPPSDESLYRSVLIRTSVFTGLLAIYPLFVGFYLSRGKIRNEVQHWPDR